MSLGFKVSVCKVEVGFVRTRGGKFCCRFLLSTRCWTHQDLLLPYIRDLRHEDRCRSTSVQELGMQTGPLRADSETGASNTNVELQETASSEEFMVSAL